MTGTISDSVTVRTKKIQSGKYTTYLTRQEIMSEDGQRVSYYHFRILGGLAVFRASKVYSSLEDAMSSSVQAIRLLEDLHVEDSGPFWKDTESVDEG